MRIHKKRWMIVVIGVMLFNSCNTPPDTKLTKQKVSKILDQWHMAAAEANFEQYFDHFSSDSAIFMGTDATERWTVAEFKLWAKPYFERGRAWDFTPVGRNVYFSKNRATAWFDESLDTPNLGTVRGSGVLVKQDTTWKIIHYNLSIPIPNAIADTVVQKVEEALQDTGSR